jgi:hypothetical protein
MATLEEYVPPRAARFWSVWEPAEWFPKTTLAGLSSPAFVVPEASTRHTGRQDKRKCSGLFSTQLTEISKALGSHTSAIPSQSVHAPLTTQTVHSFPTAHTCTICDFYTLESCYTIVEKVITSFGHQMKVFKSITCGMLAYFPMCHVIDGTDCMGQH